VSGDILLQYTDTESIQDYTPGQETPQHANDEMFIPEAQSAEDIRYQQ
jgi:hypothetical protein